MVIRGESIGNQVKYWVKPDIENRIKEGNINALYNSELTKITNDFVEIKTPKGIQKISNDYVVALTGYLPDFEFLKQCGIKYSNDDKHIPIYNEDTMESNIKGLYLAGVICGGTETHKWFIENSRIHAIQITNHISNFMT